MEYTYAKWLELDHESRARHIVETMVIGKPPYWATYNVLFEFLFDPHPRTDHLRRIFVDVTGVDFLSSEYVRLFYGSRGYSRGMEMRSAGELLELRSSEYDIDAGPPDLGHDFDYEAKLSNVIRKLIEVELSGTESQFHEEMLSRCQMHAVVDTYTLDVSIDSINVSIVLTHISLSNGDTFFIMPWSEERIWDEIVEGDWIEIGGADDDDKTYRSRTSLYSDESDSSDLVDKMDEVDLQGLDLALPEPDEASPDQADSWREQLRNEYPEEEEYRDQEDVSPDRLKKQSGVSDDDPLSDLNWKL